MKKFTVLFLFLLFITPKAQVNWMTLEDAVKAQTETPRKILINFYADWCGQCKSMDKSTFSNPVIAQLINENYYPVKFNAEGNDTVNMMGRIFTNDNFASGKTKNSLHGFTQFMNVNAVPAIVFLDTKSQPITMIQGALTAKELEPYLLMISTDEYKKIETRDKWESFQKKFKSKIKD